jgi:hypothetical protein
MTLGLIVNNDYIKCCIFIVMLSAIILNHLFIVVMLDVFKLSVMEPLLNRLGGLYYKNITDS